MDATKFRNRCSGSFCHSTVIVSFNSCLLDGPRVLLQIFSFKHCPTVFYQIEIGTLSQPGYWRHSVISFPFGNTIAQWAAALSSWKNVGFQLVSCVVLLYHLLWIQEAQCHHTWYRYQIIYDVCTCAHGQPLFSRFPPYILNYTQPSFPFILILISSVKTTFATPRSCLCASEVC